MSKDIKVALVIGENRGVVYELVKQLALNGFKVILTSPDPEEDSLEMENKLISNNTVSANYLVFKYGSM